MGLEQWRGWQANKVTPSLNNYFSLCVNNKVKVSNCWCDLQCMSFIWLSFNSKNIVIALLYMYLQNGEPLSDILSQLQLCQCWIMNCFFRLEKSTAFSRRKKSIFQIVFKHFPGNAPVIWNPWPPPPPPHSLFIQVKVSEGEWCTPPSPLFHTHIVFPL